MVRRTSAFALAVLVGCNAVAGLDALEISGATATGQGGAASSASSGTTGGGEGGATAGSGGAAQGGGGATPCPDDLTSDPDHCGACNHSCLGGACEAGECQPFVVASVDMPIGIGLVGDTFYFTEFITGGRIMKKAPGDAVPVPLSSGDARPAYLDFYDGRVYWSVYDDSLIKSMALDGSDERIELDGMPQVDRPTGLHIEDSTLYWSNHKGSSSGSIYYKNLVGSVAPVLLIAAQDGPEDMAIDNGTLIYAEEFDGQVRALPLAGGASSLLSAFTDPVGIALDADWLYVTDQTDDTVFRMPKTGGVPEPIATNQEGASQVIVTDDAIYWANYYGSQAMGLAK